MDEFDEFRMKKNMSDEMKYREKVICFPFILSDNSSSLIF